MSMEAVLAPPGARFTLAARLAVALLQAGALYFLTTSLGPPKTWPATDALWYAPLILVASFLPVVIMLGLGQIRPAPLALWACVAAALCAGLGLHDATRGAALADANADPGPTPAFYLWPVLTVVLFIAHTLAVDAIAERTIASSYARHFDTSWKMAVQLALAFVFVAAFWGLLFLGAGLFALVNVDVFRRAIEDWRFIYPATTLALAASLHVTDVQSALLRGARNLTLTLFAWLAPVLAVILGGFLCALPFLSLASLWGTHISARLFLVAAAGLVLLINACHEDGSPQWARSRVKALAAAAGAVELPIITALAAVAIGLRVQQYGWTTDRVFAAALTALLALYGAGYVIAVALSPTTMRRLETTNRIGAYCAIAIALALFTPLADPARLMTQSQVARLLSGAVTPDKFDFAALRFGGARWGAAALARLGAITDVPNAADIRAKVALVLAARDRYAAGPDGGGQMATQERIARISLHPEGRTLPQSFIDSFVAPGGSTILQQCFGASDGAKCEARFVVLSAQGPEALIVFHPAFTDVFFQDQDGKWSKGGRVDLPYGCNGFKAALQTGNFTLEAHPWKDLVVGGLRMTIIPDQPPAPCTTP